MNDSMKRLVQLKNTHLTQQKECVTGVTDLKTIVKLCVLQYFMCLVLCGKTDV